MQTHFSSLAVIKVTVIAISFSFGTPSYSQEGVNVVQFLDAVARVCGGSSSENISVEGDNVSLRTTEITIDPGTGSLKVERDGILIAEIDGERSSAYYDCVSDLTEALGGVFSGSGSTLKPSDIIGYSEPTRDEMLAAHSDQVSVGLIFMSIDHFEKIGCRPSNSFGYDCSYTIRSGGFGTPRFVTNTFAKSGGDWVMVIDRQ